MSQTLKKGIRSIRNAFNFSFTHEHFRSIKTFRNHFSLFQERNRLLLCVKLLWSLLLFLAKQGHVFPLEKKKTKLRQQSQLTEGIQVASEDPDQKLFSGHAERIHSDYVQHSNVVDGIVPQQFLPLVLHSQES